jgi:hypothetical protein
MAASCRAWRVADATDRPLTLAHDAIHVTRDPTQPMPCPGVRGRSEAHSRTALTSDPGQPARKRSVARSPRGGASFQAPATGPGTTGFAAFASGLDQCIPVSFRFGFLEPVSSLSLPLTRFWQYSGHRAASRLRVSRRHGAYAGGEACPACGGSGDVGAGSGRFVSGSDERGSGKPPNDVSSFRELPMYPSRNHQQAPTTMA